MGNVYRRPKMREAARIAALTRILGSGNCRAVRYKGTRFKTGGAPNRSPLGVKFRIGVTKRTTNSPTDCCNGRGFKGGPSNGDPLTTMPNLRGCRNASAFLDRTLALRTRGTLGGTRGDSGPFFLCVTRCTMRAPVRPSLHFCRGCVSGKLPPMRTTCTALVRKVSGDLNSLVSCLGRGGLRSGAIVLFVSSGNKLTTRAHTKRLRIRGCPLGDNGNSTCRKKIHRPVVID